MTVTIHDGNFVSEVNLVLTGSTVLWALHNPLKSWTLYNLSERELKLLIMSLSDSEITLVKICKKNETSWQSIDRDIHSNLLKKDNLDPFNGSADFPVVIPRSEAPTDTEYFTIKPNKVLQPRLHNRYELVIPCVLLGGNNKVFATETKDLSEGGLYFKDIVPGWIAGYFLVIVNSKYQLMCSLVEDQKEKKRVQIVSEDSDYHFVQYKNWLSTFNL